MGDMCWEFHFYQILTCYVVLVLAEIPDFLDADECELIIALAENKNLKDNPKRTDSRGIYYEDPLNTFKQWDLNWDGYIDKEEVSGIVHMFC